MPKIDYILAAAVALSALQAIVPVIAQEPIEARVTVEKIDDGTEVNSENGADPRVSEFVTPFLALLMAPDTNLSGAEMVAAFAAEDGVIQRRSGLLIRIIENGDGDLIIPDGLITVHYTGALPDGTIFDSSYARGRPSEFGMGQIVRGWREALNLMRIGSKWEVVVPGELAYGSDGLEGVIPPDTPLYFTIELIAARP